MCIHRSAGAAGRILMSPSGNGRKSLALKRRLQYACGMRNYRKTSHSVYDIKYHPVWTAKYRKPILYGDAATRVRDLIREICETMDVEIAKGHVSRDRIHLSVSVPPYISVSKPMRNIEGKTSRKLPSEYRRPSKSFWGRHLWARGYFAAGSGNVTDDTMAEYVAIRDGKERTRDDGFLIG